MAMEKQHQQAAARAEFLACETCMKDMHLTRSVVRSAADDGRTGQEGGVLAKAGRMRRGQRVNLRVRSSEFRVQSSEFRVQRSEFRRGCYDDWHVSRFLLARR